MAIYRLLQNSPFGPEESLMLGCLDRFDPTTERVAKKIIELAQTGIRDSDKLGRLALEEIGTSGSR